MLALERFPVAEITFKVHSRSSTMSIYYFFSTINYILLTLQQQCVFFKMLSICSHLMPNKAGCSSWSMMQGYCTERVHSAWCPAWWLSASHRRQCMRRMLCQGPSSTKCYVGEVFSAVQQDSLHTWPAAAGHLYRYIVQVGHIIHTCTGACLHHIASLSQLWLSSLSVSQNSMLLQWDSYTSSSCNLSRSNMSRLYGTIEIIKIIIISCF